MKKLILALAILSFPAFSFAGEISGWIPYWKVSDGVKDARAHLDILTEINPFVFSITQNGEPNDLGGIKKKIWTKLFKEARKKGVTVIPTIMSGDTTTMYRILSDNNLRKSHINEIVKMVKKGKYDGVDIDYEAKSAETKDYFSAFIIELKQALGNKELVCTIEARTSIEDQYRNGNDGAVLGKYCDQVRLMTYDQQRADVALNELNSGTPYIPVADIRWVEKVTDFNMQIIPKEKIMLGVATYGKEWELSVTPNNFGRYTSQWSVTNDYAKDFADDIDIEPYRNNAGELSFTYFPDNSPFGRLAGGYTVPRGTPEANKAALQALAYANATGNMAIVNVVWWSDAEAIKSKADLADRLGLRGISIFKIDATEDDELWDDLSN